MQQALPTRRAMLAGLGASIASTVARGAVPAVKLDRSWGDLELVDSREQAFRLGDTAAKATLVQLWANWCPVCLGEMHALETAAPGLNRRGIDVLLVSSPLDWAADLRTATSRGLEVRFARPSGRNGPGAIRSALFDADGWYYVPRSLLYDHAARRVTWSHLGRLDWQAEPWARQAALF